ncbi:MAG: hypothetical protein Q4B15_08515 [Lachnospiraceae bacterium]|nr:hypothetical protein [Lachnospiraceae bacterium]
MTRPIDADKLQMRIADIQLMAAPDERDSKDVQAECRKAVADLEELSKLIDEQPTVRPGDKFIEVLEKYYYECEERYQKISPQRTDAHIFADGEREGAYEALRRAKVMNDRA